MVREGFKRKLTAILSADVEGYSRLMDDDEEATVRTLTSYRSAITDLVQQFRGRIIDTPGDNILADFSSVVDAVNCAVEIQRDLAERNTEMPDHRHMQFRIGVNLGDVIEEEGRIYGEGVNIAARVESLSEAGGICISGRAYDHVANKLGLEYENLGEHQAKNISVPIRVYRVLTLPGAAAHRVVQAKRAIQRKWHKAVLGMAALLVIGAGALAIWSFLLRPSPPTVEPASIDRMAFQLPEQPSIAVLPFDNMSGDPEQEYIADGMTENIITVLSQIPEMFVIASNSVFTYKGKPVKIKQVGEELGVKYVLEGSVQKSGGRLRVNAQLTDALKGHHLWAERYDRELKDLFKLQDEITMKIVAAMEVKLARGEQLDSWLVNWFKTDSIEAWSHSTKGFSTINLFTEEALRKARKHFEQAVNLDPDYAFGWAWLAWTYTLEARQGWGESPGDSIKRAIELVEKAARLGENQAGIHTLKSRIYQLQGKHDEAIAESEKAVSLAPNSSRAHIFLADSLHFGGSPFGERPKKAIIHAKKAMRLEPYYPAWFMYCLGGSYGMLGRHEEANEIWRKYLERALKGEMPPIYVHERLAINYVNLDRMEEAQAHRAEIMKIKPDYTVEFFRNSNSSYGDKAYLESLIDLLRKAGLPG